jgi:WD40-like Beta Propeller Repeat
MNPIGTAIGPHLILYLTERLTNDPASDIQPAWLPDGKKIAFSSNRADQNNLANGECWPRGGLQP